MILYAEPKFVEVIVSAIETITHNTKLFILTKPAGTEVCVPVGHHVKIRALIKGTVQINCNKVVHKI